MNNIQRLNTLLAGGIVDHVPHCLCALAHKTTSRAGGDKKL